MTLHLWLAAVAVAAVATVAAAGPPTHGGLIDDLDCAACHTPTGWGLGAGAGAGFDHDRTGFALRGAHRATACAGCHDGAGPPPTTCDGCHRDPHQGRVDGACAECHAATAWSDTEALRRHRATRMPLTGRHATIECVACHTRADRTWSGVPTACYACHADAYRDPATHPDHDGDPADPTRPPLPRTCGTCHRTSGWRPAVFTPTVLTGLAVAPGHDARFVVSTGAHRDLACASCHVDARRPNRARCDGCHPPRALVDHPRAARTGGRASTCLGCHPRGRR